MSVTTHKTDSRKQAAGSLSAFAATFYAEKQVQQALLQLQDEHALDVLLLLTACWLGRRGVTVEAIDWADLLQRHQPWQQQVISPLRAVRRAMRAWPEASELREHIKASELAAEWMQLSRLEQWLTADAGDEPPTTLAQLQACCQAQGATPPASLLIQLS
ncbi:MAG: TIGR02444 family protein [Pseudomonadaceae bacterium]|nr:MAG: TIGR02444 family protein [Pseudomonadaceae bacterium]